MDSQEAGQGGSVRASGAAYSALTRLAGTLTSMTGRRVTMSEAMLAACRVASDDPETTVARLQNGQ